jgi:hypothetical protein
LYLLKYRFLRSNYRFVTGFKLLLVSLNLSQDHAFVVPLIKGLLQQMIKLDLLSVSLLLLKLKLFPLLLGYVSTSLQSDSLLAEVRLVVL